jgi:hypothetical protein
MAPGSNKKCRLSTRKFDLRLKLGSTAAKPCKKYERSTCNTKAKAIVVENRRFEDWLGRGTLRVLE